MKKFSHKIFLTLILALLFVIPFFSNTIWADNPDSMSTEPVQQPSALNQTPTNPSDINSWMPDKKLQNALKVILGKNVPLTPTNLAKLTSADLSFDNLTDLTGLQYATKLQKLNLNGNKLTALTALQSLTNLQTLSVASNNITDLSPLHSLSKLTVFDFHVNNAKIQPDLTPLASTSLQNLNLAGDNYGDTPEKLGALANLPHLTTISLVLNKLTSVPAFAPNAPLTSVDVSGNKITDPSSLAKYPNLTYLGISSNKISDWQPLASLSNLTTLIAGNNPQTNISVLNKLTKLQKLNLSQVGLTNQSLNQLVANMTNLQSLSIDFNSGITDLTLLAKLKNLTYLNFSNDAVSDLTPLSNLTNLTTLSFLSNQVSDVTPLQKLTNLATLTFLRNHVLDLSPLKNLNNLQYLNANFQLINAPALTYNANQPLTTTLSAKGIDGSVIPLTSTDPNVRIKQDQLTFNGITANTSDTFGWDNRASSNGDSNFTGSIVQPITFVPASPTPSNTGSGDTPANPSTKPQPVNLVITKGDDSGLTSVANNYILPQASLTTNPDGSGSLNFQLQVPTAYGKNSITFNGATQASAVAAGDSYILTYQLPLTAAQLTAPKFLEQMHVNIAFTGFNYNNTYTVTFNIQHNANYAPFTPGNPFIPTNTGTPVNTAGQSGTNTSGTLNNTGNSSKPANLGKSKPASPIAKSVGLGITKGDGSGEDSVASQYILSAATLATNPDGNDNLVFTAKVPLVYGRNSIVFKNAKQISATKTGNSYIMVYQLPLTAAQLAQPGVFEQMHVDINFNGFVYNNTYNVFFNIHHNVTTVPHNLSTSNSSKRPSLDNLLSSLTTGGSNGSTSIPAATTQHVINSMPNVVPTNHEPLTTDRVTNAQQVLNLANGSANAAANVMPALTAPTTPVHGAANTPVKVANTNGIIKQRAQANATPSNKTNSIHDAIAKALAFVAALLGIVGIYYLWTLKKRP